MTLGQLLDALGGERELAPGALADALHDGEGVETPMLVRAFTAIGTWIAALMLGLLFAAMELHESLPVAIVVSLASLVAAARLSRRPRLGLARSQLVWALALGSVLLALGAVAELDPPEGTMAFACLLANLVVIAAVRLPGFRLIGVVCAFPSALWVAYEAALPMYPLWVALPAIALGTLAWLREDRWAPRLGRSWSALAYGLPLGVTLPLSFASISHLDSDLGFGGTTGLLCTGAVLACTAAVLWQIQRRSPEPLPARAHALGPFLLLVGILARHVPGIPLALLWLIVAHAQRARTLTVIALVELAGFLTFFYYQLETTLLAKSIWVLSTGLVMLLGARLARPTKTEDAASPSAATPSRWRVLPMALLPLGLIVFPTLEKEWRLAHGESVLLPLAPVDPRSLMQGDYMALRYGIERDAADALETQPDAPRRGRLVVHLDADAVATFRRLDDDAPLGPDERWLEYRVRDGSWEPVRVASQSFFFEEGTASLYAQARYGEVVLSKDGGALLVGLRDEQRRPLGARLEATWFAAD